MINRIGQSLTLPRDLSRKPPAAPSRSFASLLGKPARRGDRVAPASGIPTLQRTAGELERQRRQIDRLLGQAARGRSFSPVELIALQARVYDYSQQLETFSRLVDRAVTAAKTTLNTPV